MVNNDNKLMRIGVFYDGNFFVHVSNYYRYSHPRSKRISIPGLHNFIRHHTAMLEGIDSRYCQIVDAHYFRGRLSASAADARQSLYNERVFDDVLMGEGVVTHYLPVKYGQEKGIDVWLALEAFELAIYKKFNLVVLIAGDSDFVPLVRKLNSIGTRVMVLGWDFEYTNQMGQEMKTTTSFRLLDEATYPVMMNPIIDDKTRRDDSLIRDLFVESHRPPRVWQEEEEGAGGEDDEVEEDDSQAVMLPQQIKGEYEGEIHSLFDGYGFIRHKDFPNNVFFHWQSLVDTEFASLQKSDRVRFMEVKEGPRGPVAGKVIAI